MRLTDGIGRRLVLGNQYATELFDKLRTLEDIEDDIQLPLTVFYKLFKHFYIEQPKHKKIPVYTIYSQEDLFVCAVAFKDKNIYIEFKDKTKLNAAKWSVQKFSDYGKTWALTKEELE